VLLPFRLELNRSPLERMPDIPPSEAPGTIIDDDDDASVDADADADADADVDVDEDVSFCPLVLCERLG